MILNATSTYTPHPEGIHAAVCVDVIDLGLVPSEYQGRARLVPKLRLVFETDQVTDEGHRFTLARTFTASLSPKAALTDFLGKWRGRPVLPGESIDLHKLLGVSCTLVISHEQKQDRIYASIDAVSRPTKKLTPSGQYDPKAARARLEEWKAGLVKTAAVAAPVRPPQLPSPAPVPQQSAPAPTVANEPEIDF